MNRHFSRARALFSRPILAALPALLLLCACSRSAEKTQPTPDYIPVRTSADGKWGLMAPDGKLLFSDRFASEPSVALEGIFSVAEGETFSLYRAKSAPERINRKPLASAGAFSGGIAPVSYPGSRITLIDTQGNDVATLMPVDGKELLKSDVLFHDGLLEVTTADGKFGFVNTKGEPVIRPIYDAALPFAAGYAMVAKVKDPSDPSASLLVSVIDTKGETVMDVEPGYEVVDLDFPSRRLIVKNINGRLGFLSFKNEFTQAPAEVANILEAYSGGYVFSNDKGLCGTIDSKGDVAVKPVYDDLSYVSEGRFIAHRGDDWSLAGADGKTLVRFGMASNVGYLEPFGFFVYDRKTCRLTDDKGKQKGHLTLFGVGNNASACSSVRSDYQSQQRIASEIASIASPAGILSFAWGTPAARIAASPDAATGIYAAFPAASRSGVDFLLNAIGIFSAPVGTEHFDEATGAGFNFNPQALLTGADFYLRCEAPISGKLTDSIKKELASRGYRPATQEGAPAGFFAMESDASVFYFCQLRDAHDANFFIGAKADEATASRWQKIISDGALSGALPTTEQLFGPASAPAAESVQDTYVDRTKPRTDSGERVSSRTTPSAASR